MRWGFFLALLVGIVSVASDNGKNLVQKSLSALFLAGTCMPAEGWLRSRWLPSQCHTQPCSTALGRQGGGLHQPHLLNPKFFHAAA